MTKQIFGTDDSVNACDCCGKTGLKFTFIVDVDGDILHYGSTCVTKWTGKTATKANAEIADRAAAKQAKLQAEFDRTPEAMAYAVKMAQAHNARLVGAAFRDFCAVERAAADAKRREIFA